MVLVQILIVLLICSVLFCLIGYIRPSLYSFITGSSPGTLAVPIISDFPLGIPVYPEYINMKAPDVLAELNKDHPEFSLEIVNIDTMSTYDIVNYRSDRIRIFVSRGGLVKQILIG